MLRSFPRSISLRVACRTTRLLCAPPYLQLSSVISSPFPTMPPKRKRSAVASTPSTVDSPALAMDISQIRKTEVPLPPNVSKLPRRQSSRGVKAEKTDPTVNPEILDGAAALRASPDGHEDAPVDSVLKPLVSDAPVASATNKKRKNAGAQKVKVEEEEEDTSVKMSNGVVDPATDAGVPGDPEDAEGAEGEEGDEAEFKEALSRPPPVNSSYLPLPWKGRLGYACLNTYLRSSNPPVFSSRTCRIASIIEHRHPLKDPSQPEHATKNRPDKDQPADIERGMKYVEEIGLANARDVSKMVRWNDKYGIKFMRLSSEMFPFASHEEYGYKLEPFAAETLQEVGKVIAELGHRVTTHPGQFTQLGSPRKQVIDNAMRDLEYHDEMLSLLKLPEQQNRDAVMILHLGGAYGDKPAAIERFKENYARLPQSVKNRLVLENDDVVWSVHELLPLCEELNIPFVLDYHHHNIIFDETQIREGTKDIMELYPRILKTWQRKGITPKMHYSEPTPAAITRTTRRKHSPRVMTLPPCPDTMDLMIEAKDKEQAVFELMRTFKLPGFDTFNDILPHTRQDENRPWKPKAKKAATKGRKKKTDDLDDLDAKIEDAEEEDKPPPVVPEEEVGMGGPEGRVYWPPGMEDWLRPPKRIIKKKDEGAATPAKKKRKTAGDAGSVTSEIAPPEDIKTPVKTAAKKATSKVKRGVAKATTSKKKTAPKSAPTPSASDEDDEDELSTPPLSDVGTDEDDAPAVQKRNARPAPTRNKSARATARISYKEEEADEIGP